MSHDIQHNTNRHWQRLYSIVPVFNWVPGSHYSKDKLYWLLFIVIWSGIVIKPDRTTLVGRKSHLERCELEVGQFPCNKGVISYCRIILTTFYLFFDYLGSKYKNERNTMQDTSYEEQFSKEILVRWVMSATLGIYYLQ